MSNRTVFKRNNVTTSGTHGPFLVFAHGFGCDQNMWNMLIPKLTRDYRIVCFDYVGSGQSDWSAFDVQRYARLDGYADDILDILEQLDLTDVTLIGHSVSAMTCMIAAIRAPERVSKLVMVCPSPYYMNDLPDYKGGFERSDLEQLLNMMDKNYIGWAHYLAPLVLGPNADDPLLQTLTNSFCSTDPVAAKTFARATFFSDCRDILPNCQVPTLVLQSGADALVPVAVGEYVSAHLRHSHLKVLETHGHCIHMSDPALTAKEIEFFLAQN